MELYRQYHEIVRKILYAETGILRMEKRNMIDL